VFTSSGNFLVGQPLEGFARLVDRTQVEPAITAGAGLKYRASRFGQLQADFRTDFSPVPEGLGGPAWGGW
jgi:hypothetical protein